MSNSETPEQALEHLEEALHQLFALGVQDLYERIDERLMISAYRFCQLNQLQTARLLGISRNVVRARLIAHGALIGARRSAESSG
jgi:sigma-54-specific transcriptional regulator